jgi:hypothetical protein
MYKQVTPGVEMKKLHLPQDKPGLAILYICAMTGWDVNGLEFSRTSQIFTDPATNEHFEVDDVFEKAEQLWRDGQWTHAKLMEKLPISSVGKTSGPNSSS